MDLSEEEKRKADSNKKDLERSFEEEKLRDYIGDGIYVRFDGKGIWLYANDYSNPTDKIYLEPFVFGALISFAKRMGWEIK